MHLAVASMLARAEMRRAWRLLLTLSVLAGVMLGVALAATQVARRTSTAYDRLVETTGTPDAVVLVLGGTRDAGAVARLPQVESSWTTAAGVARVDRGPLTYLGVFAPTGPPPPGLFTPVYVDGHAPDPDSATDLVVSERLARDLDLHVGDRLPLSFLTTEEVTQFDTGFGRPDGPSVSMSVVGVVRVVDDDTANSAQAFSTPALARRIQEGGSSYPNVFVRLHDGLHQLPAFRASVQQLATASQPEVGAGEFLGYQVQSPLRQRAAVDVTTRVLVVGLAVFAITTVAAALLACGLALRRHFAVSDIAPGILRSLGATRAQIRTARLVTTLPFVGLATVLAVVTTLATAGIGPAGSIGRQEPHPGWAPNAGVVAFGALVVVLLLLAVAAISSEPRRRATTRRRPSSATEWLADTGAPTEVVLGSRFALERGRGRGALPMRAALLTAMVVVAGVVAILVWSTSVDRLVDRPDRWGWVADAFVDDVQPATVRSLVDDPRTAAVSVVQEADLDVAGHTTTAASFSDRKGTVGWTVSEGRMPERDSEILLGARLARSLDKDVGSRVTIFTRAGRQVPLDVVGIGSGPDRTNDQFANGVVVDAGELPRIALTEPFSGAAITYRADVDPARASAAIGRDVEVSSPTRPADLENLAQLGRLPDLLVAVLVLLVLAVLFHALVTLTRRRRGEFDTLRAVGLRPRQAQRTVYVTALVCAAVGVLVGVPLGFVVGRFGWRVTEHALYVKPAPVQPLVVVAAVVVGAVIAALVVAAWPAWAVAHGRDASPHERGQLLRRVESG
jgi:ABC-type lipoprotein release transport system permease subunit